MASKIINVEITILPPHEESNDAPKIYTFDTEEINIEMIGMERHLPPFTWKIVE
jgi:hypothetical protein